MGGILKLTHRGNEMSGPCSHQIRLKKKFEDFVVTLSKVPPVESNFKVNDVVTFTNDSGVEFPGMTIIGFSYDTSFYGRFIYVAFPGDRAYSGGCAYWFPHKPEELKING